MNKRIFSLASIILLILFCSLPSTIAQGVKLGIKFDPQFSWFSVKGGDIATEGSHFGFDGGLIMDFYFAENYAFATGVSISSTGGDFYSNTDIEIEVDNNIQVVPAGEILEYKLQYVNIPLSLKLKTREFGYSTFYAQLGFTAQMNIGSTVKAGNTVTAGNIKNEINFFDMGYHFGAGLEYSLGEKTALTAGVLFKNGFIDVTSNDDYSMVLNTLSIRIGVLF
jgi:hypothetical protein